MRAFVVRAGVFAILCGGVFGGWAYALYRLEVQAYQREVNIPPDTQIVVCGDSHLETGFDPRCWPNSFNFALSAITLDQLELKVYGLLKENPSYRGLVVVDIWPEKLFKPNVDQPLVTSGPAGKRLMLHWLYPEANRRPMDGMAKLFRDAILAKRTRTAFKALTRGKPYKSSVGGVGVLGGKTPEPDEVVAKEGFTTHPEVVAETIRRKAATINGFPPYSKTSKQHEVIANMVRIVRAHGCKLVMVTTPLHGKMLAAIDAGRLRAFNEAMRELSEELDFPYVNALSWEFPDACWQDGDHLNARGALFFTRRLKGEVANVL